MNKCYERLNFVNDKAPALSAQNLNKIDTALDTMDDRIVHLDSMIGTGGGTGGSGLGVDTEIWTFKMKDGSTLTRVVVLNKRVF